MSENNDDWGEFDSADAKQKEERSKLWFNLKEGENRFQILTKIVPLVQVWDGVKYIIAPKGSTKTTIKGLCYVLQDGIIKEAKLPYQVVKLVRELQANQDWGWDGFPAPRYVTVTAADNGKKFNGKTVLDYTILPAPKETAVPQEALTVLAEKPSPEDIIARMKAKSDAPAPKHEEEEDDGIDPDKIPF